MPSTVTERDALLSVSIGNLGLDMQRGHISSELAGQVALALVQADDASDLKRLRFLAGECDRATRMFRLLDAAEGLTPEAATMGRMFAIATLRAATLD